MILVRRFLKRFVILLAVVIIIYFFSISQNKTGSLSPNVDDIKLDNVNDVDGNLKCQKYKLECMNLYNKLLHPDPELILRPPPKEPPKEMMNDFIQNGEMPIKRYWYLNEAYSDSASNNTQNIPVIKNSVLDKWRERVKNGERLEYNDLNVRNAMFEYKEDIKDKKTVVVGTREVWIEAVAMEVGSAKVTTLEYTRMAYENKDLLEWIHVNDYLQKSIETNEFEEFDTAVSFSSIEHSGLGRYGDPLSPYGDVEAVKQMHCMLKPNGLLFLGVPMSYDDSSYIEFNAHRIYGSKRLNLLFDGWTRLEKTYTKDNSFNHHVFVLKKNGVC